MHYKTLKESAASLSLLILDGDVASRALLHSQLGRYFGEIYTAASSDDVVMLWEASTVHLTIINLDTLEDDPFEFIALVQRKDPFHPIVALTQRLDDAVLLHALIEHALCGVAPLPLHEKSAQSVLIRALSKLTHKIYEHLVLLHYAESLETPHLFALAASPQEQHPVASTPKPPLASSNTEDFDFFPVATSTTTPTQEHNIYHDYFNLLQGDDKEELFDQLSDIDAAHAMAFPDGDIGDEGAIARLGGSLMRFGNVLLHYQFFCDMGTGILELGKTLHDEAPTVAQNASTLELYVSGFCSVLQNYMHDVWEMECANPKFFNDSIINDAQTIIGMIAPAPATAHDDAFFF